MLVPSSRAAVVIACPVSGRMSKPGFGGDWYRSLSRSQRRLQFGAKTPSDAARYLARNLAPARPFERGFRVESENPVVLVVCSPN